MEEENIRKLTRFIKSYKYKHKPPPSLADRAIDVDFENGSCDTQNVQNVNRKSTHHHHSRSRHLPARFLPKMVPLLLLLFLIFQILPTKSSAFCPFKCLCDDQSLSANCTQVPSITTIPMTFNPLLKQLTLNHLPMAELSNSLSVYRRLEYLNLNSNLLHQIRYQNFNFKPAPPSVVLSSSGHNHHTNHPPLLQAPGSADKFPSGYATFELTNLSNEQLARNLKQTIDKSISQSGAGSASSSGGGASNEDEIRFHLRDMDLGDNRISQLGFLDQLEDGEGGELSGGVFGSSSELLGSNSGAGNLRLRSQELERLAPFLTLTRLENLNLSGNRLTRLHQHVFLGLVNLKRLDLSRNQIESIDKLAFVGLIELELLKLDHNRLANHLQPLSLAFCRAPMMELRFLDLSNNHKSSQQDQDVLLPNQMFICAPRLVSLRLDGLQLRYIQVNAFDNLQQLETLNLSRNYLEQVPSDPLGYSNSNLSLSLRQLDLSDNLIEFVNARSFGSLGNLQKLCLNQMARLVSFDLAALAWQEKKTRERMMVVNGHELMQMINGQLIELQLRQNPRLQSLHSSLAVRSEPPRGRMRFTKLRLLDLHGAVELRDFNLNEMMDLDSPPSDGNGNDNLLSLLQVDLSQVTKLNCSSCQMSWLVEAAKRQHRLATPGNDWRPPPVQMAHDPFSVRPTSLTATNSVPHQTTTSKRILLTGSIVCSWPFAMPLEQLIDLETSFAPIFAQNCNLQPPNSEEADNGRLSPQSPPLLSTTSPGLVNNGNQLNHDLSEPQPPPNLTPVQTLASDGSMSSLTLAGLLVLVVIFAGSKLILSLLFVHCRRLHKPSGRTRSEFRWWRSPSLAPSSTTMESPSSASTTNNPMGHSSSPADCSSSSILSSNAMANGLYGRKQQQQQPCHQFERQHQQIQQQHQLPEHQLGRKQQYDRGRLTGIEGPNGAEADARQQQQLLEQQLNNQLFMDGGGCGGFKPLGGSQRNSSLDVACRAGGSNSHSGGAAIQIEWRPPSHRHRRGNLFSRIAERLSATTTSWRPSPLGLVVASGGGGGGIAERKGGSILGPDRKLALLAGNPFASTSTSTSTYEGPCSAPARHFGTCIIENVVYGGGACDDKILADNNNNNNISANETSPAPQTLKSTALGPRAEARLDSTLQQQQQQQHLIASSGNGSCNSGQRLGMLLAGGQADFIKPAYECQQQEKFLGPSQMGGRRRRSKRNEPGGSIMEGLDSVYANCQEQELDGLGASSGLIVEPTSCSRQQGPKQMMVKQLGAIEMDPRKQMLVAAAIGPSSDSPQPKLLQHQTAQWVHHSTTTNTCLATSSSLSTSTNGGQHPRYSSGVGGSSVAHPGLANSQATVQPIYLDAGRGFGSGGGGGGNNSSQPLIMDPRTMSLAKSASRMAPKSKLDSPLALDSGSHIYVTLDRPIKQQNSCDEYGHYNEQPQQQQQQLELEQLEIMRQPNELAAKDNGGSYASIDGFNDNGAPTSRLGNCPAEKYKSFEWTFSGGGRPAGNLNGNISSGPLEGREGDKFKLVNEEVGHVNGQGMDCWRQQKQQLAGQSGGKLSSPLQKFEGNIRQQEQQDPIILANTMNRRNHRAPLPELPIEATAAVEREQQWQFARVSPVAASGRGGFGINSGGDQMYGNKNGHNNSDFVKGRKSKEESRQAGEGGGGGGQVFLEGQATGYDNVTGHTDYHDDDDDDDDDVGNGIAQRGSNVVNQLNGGMGRQPQQLFMDLNSLAETTTTSNEFGGPKWGLAVATSTSTTTQMPPPPQAEVASLNGSLDQAHHTGAGSGSKYDANHGPTTNLKPAPNSNKPKQTASRLAQSSRTEGGRPLAPSDNSNYNCVINGLKQQQEQHSIAGGCYVAGQNYGQVESGRQMGVAKSSVGPLGAKASNHDIGDRNTRDGKTNSNNNASNLSPIMGDDDDATSGKHSILIGQQMGTNFVARGSEASNYAARLLLGSQKANGSCELASDYDDDGRCGRQKLCDNLPEASGGVGAPTSRGSSLGEPRKRASDDSSDSSSNNSSQLAGNSNEIYSNQFYYCKPTTTNAATLTRGSNSRTRRKVLD